MIRSGILSLAVCAMTVGVVAAEDLTRDQIIDAFVQSLKENDQIEDLDRSRALEAVDDLRRDRRAQGTVINEGLRLAYPQFGKALAALGDERYDDATQTFDELMNAENRFLATSAMLFQSRSYAMQHRHDEALGLLQDIEANHKNNTLNLPEVVFLTAEAEAQLLQREEAIATFNRFLQDFPDAPRRLRDAAVAHLEKLDEIDFSLLNDVHDKMSFSHRQLTKEESGQRTQKVQENVVALLTELIEEIEKKGGS